jgi:8-oxo-dGTP pyrophosphatase MutT (NUDIX family)
MVSNPLTPTSYDAIRVVRVSSVELTFAPDLLRPSALHQAAIDDHWRAACARNPRYFNGTILVGVEMKQRADAFTATCRPFQFKDFFYWRHVGRPDWGFVDLFGSAIVRANAGEILLGVAASTTMNAGAAYFVGGFLDLRDCTPDNRVDITASIARELAEETGLTSLDAVASLQLAPGFWITIDGRMISIAAEWQATQSAAALRDSVLAFSHASADQELADVLIISQPDDLADPRILPFTRAMCHKLLAQ